MRLAAGVVLAAVAACSPFKGGAAFTCETDTDCAGGPGPGRCELATGFCSFEDGSCPSGQRYGSSSGSLSNVCVGDEPPVDAAVDGNADAPGDGPPGDAACAIGGLDLCAQTPMPAWVVSNNTNFNTSNNPMCTAFAQGGGGGEACLVYASSVTIDAGATLRVTGNRPLIIASVAGISVAGTIEASSQRGGPSGPAANHNQGCAPATQAENDSGGAAGGAGGSFGGKGGDGGRGDNDNSLGNDGVANGGTASNPLGAPPAFARGGCAGSDGGDEGGGGGSGDGGAGGASGGSVWLVANGTIEIPASGAIRANGAGGDGGEVQAGGGGAGSGGYLRLAGGMIAVAGAVVAHGGSGGGGGCRCNGVPVSGTSGGDGATNGTIVQGGAGASGVAGNGGASSGGATVAASNGGESNVGGGGGGGGAGFVVFVGPASVSGTVSPPPQ